MKRTDQVLAEMSREPEPVRTIAARLGWEVLDTERALYELAGIRPGQVQARGRGDRGEPSGDLAGSTGAVVAACCVIIRASPVV